MASLLWPNRLFICTSPYPQTRTCFPPNITSVVLFKLWDRRHKLVHYIKCMQDKIITSQFYTWAHCTHVQRKCSLQSQSSDSDSHSDFFLLCTFKKHNINNIYRNYMKYKKRRDKATDPKSMWKTSSLMHSLWMPAYCHNKNKFTKYELPKHIV